MTNKYCSECGSEIVDSSKGCEKCGKKIKQSKKNDHAGIIVFSIIIGLLSLFVWALFQGRNSGVLSGFILLIERIPFHSEIITAVLVVSLLILTRSLWK